MTAREGKNRLIYAVDLDGTLCNGIWWGEGDHPEPHLGRIKMINDLYHQGHVIIIHTGRREYMRPATEAWLHQHGVKFHAMVMNKLGADVYIDDRAVRDTDFFHDVCTPSEVSTA